VAAAFPRVFEFHSPVGNEFIVATMGSAVEENSPDTDKVPARLREAVSRTLATGHLVEPRELTGARPITDEQNVFSVIFADAQMRLRRKVVRLFPPHVLVN
jgi:hypothetical protein